MPAVSEGRVPRSARGSGWLPLALLATLLLALKLPTLGTPAYWDEMGWLEQARALSEGSLLKAIPGLRPAAMFWGHPPGLHLTLATLWKLFDPSPASAHLLIAGFAATGVCAAFLLGRLLADQKTAWLSALFLLLSPLYLAQSGMFLADVPVAALGILSAYLALQRRFRAYLVCASCMVFFKETALALVAALVLYRVLFAVPHPRATLREAVYLAVPGLLLGAFFVLQKLTTGHFFFIYDFDIELFHLTADSVRNQFVRITRWVFVEQHRFVLTAVIALNLLLHPAARRRGELRLFLLVLLLSGYSFSVLYFLPRYLLPVLPFFYLLAASALLELARGRRRQLVASLATLAFLIWSLTAQRFRGNGETDLSYLRVVALHRTMAERLATSHAGERIVTVWPLTDELSRPFVGYVATPLPVKRFSAGGDLQGSDLAVVGAPAERRAAELRRVLREQGWILLQRLGAGPLELALYRRPDAGTR